MKVNLLLIFLLFFGNYQFAQTAIDYNNFDERKASLALADAYLNFRDTITCHALGVPESNYSIMSPDLNKNKLLRKVVWNEWVYKNVTQKNCEYAMSLGDNLIHKDVEKWYKENQSLITKEVLKGRKYSNPIHKVAYNEVMFQHKSTKYKTYEELASAIIRCLDKSDIHSGIIRGENYSISEYKNGVVLTASFASNVKYNKNINYIKAVINIIEIQ
jgi:hypothetical protein